MNKKKSNFFRKLFLFYDVSSQLKVYHFWYLCIVLCIIHHDTPQRHCSLQQHINIKYVYYLYSNTRYYYFNYFWKIIYRNTSQWILLTKLFLLGLKHLIYLVVRYIIYHYIKWFRNIFQAVSHLVHLKM